MKNEKIFENYFKQNMNTDQEIAKVITDVVNEVLNDLPDGSPMKTRAVGLEIMATVRKILEEDK